jgi:hypothetical protein
MGAFRRSRTPSLRRDSKNHSVDGLGAVSGGGQSNGDRLRLPNVVSVQPTKLLFYSLGSS